MASTVLASIPDEILPVYAQEAILAAQPLYVYRNFVEYKQQLGIEPGKTIQFLKLSDLTGGGALSSEFEPVFKEAMSESTVSITVFEAAGAVQVSRAALTASFRDVMSDAAVLLGRRFAKYLDTYLRDIFSGTANELYAGGAVNEAAIAAGSDFDTEVIKDAAEILKTMNAPTLFRNGDQHYVCVAHPHQLRTLRDDTAWQNARQYVDPRDIYNGEVGRYENVVFIETTQQGIDSGAGAGGIDIYKALFMGGRAVGYAETVPMELVTDGVEEFGRFISLGWYTIHGAAILNDYLVEAFTA